MCGRTIEEHLSANVCVLADAASHGHGIDFLYTDVLYVCDVRMYVSAYVRICV